MKHVNINFYGCVTLIFVLMSFGGILRSQTIESSAFCDIMIESLTNVSCDDKGTVSDPSDDEFRFDMTVIGMEVGSGWYANDSNNTAGNYGEPVGFGPFVIEDGDVQFIIRDNDDSVCFEMVTIDPPSTCSDECSLSVAVSNFRCDDNGTSTNIADDVFYFDMMVTGSNTGLKWFSNDIYDTDGAYDTLKVMGPYAISDGPFNLVIRDVADVLCSIDTLIQSPEPCSDECALEFLVQKIQCDDNSTPFDPSDDLYYFDLLVTGNGFGTQWFADDTFNTVGSYNDTKTMGPYAIAWGDLSILVVDSSDSTCFTTIDVLAPPPCSGQCQIDASVSNILCSNAGTPFDATDDLFTFELTMTGVNISANWVADDTFQTMGDYGIPTLMGPYLISAGNLSLIISDSIDTGCTSQVNVNAPEPCPLNCLLGLELGQDLIIDCDSLSISVFPTFENNLGDLVTIEWSGPSQNLVQNQLKQNLDIIGQYSCQIADSVGCMANDKITLLADTDSDCGDLEVIYDVDSFPNGTGFVQTNTQLILGQNGEIRVEYNNDYLEDSLIKSLKIYDTRGVMIIQGGGASLNNLNMNLFFNQSRNVINGIYLYTVEIVMTNGRHIVQSGKLVVLK